MSRPRLLDACCCAGGATKGYQRAGFHVTGVDVAAQPHYCGDVFVQGDAVQFIRDHGHEFDAIHASPPCQTYSGMTNCRPGLAADYPDLIDVIRFEAQQHRKPWIIENVAGSGLPRQADMFGANGLELCGAMFGRALYRHRLFETSFPIAAPHHPRHLVPASKAGHWKPGTVISVAGNCYPVALARDVMDIDWTNRHELAEAIPPYFTEFIGAELRQHLASVAA